MYSLASSYFAPKRSFRFAGGIDLAPLLVALGFRCSLGRDAIRLRLHAGPLPEIGVERRKLRERLLRDAVLVREFRQFRGELRRRALELDAVIFRLCRSSIRVVADALEDVAANCIIDLVGGR
jgi:hypothetical protein